MRRKSKIKNYRNEIFFGAVLCVSRNGLSPTPTCLHVKKSPPQWGTGRVFNFLEVAHDTDKVQKKNENKRKDNQSKVVCLRWLPQDVLVNEQV